MSASALRAAIYQKIEKDPQAVIRILKSAGVRLNNEDESTISQGWLERYSDAQLLERFNQSVLKNLGIKGDFSGTHNMDDKGRATDLQQTYSARPPEG
jgi:hypothetical protein